MASTSKNLLLLTVKACGLPTYTTLVLQLRFLQVQELWPKPWAIMHPKDFEMYPGACQLMVPATLTRNTAWQWAISLSIRTQI